MAQGSAVPRIIKNFALMIDGVGYAGIADSVTLPPLTIKGDDHRGGGMDAPVEIDMGMEKLELKFSMAEHSSSVMRGFGLQDGRAVSGQFRAAKVDDKTVQAYVATFRGRYHDVTPGEVKPGEKSPMTGTISLRYYRLECAGEQLIEIDIDNFIRRIGGVDVLAEQRAAISF